MKKERERERLFIWFDILVTDCDFFHTIFISCLFWSWLVVVVRLLLSLLLLFVVLDYSCLVLQQQLFWHLFQSILLQKMLRPVQTFVKKNILSISYCCACLFFSAISTSQSFSVPIDGSGLTGSLSESERSQVGTQVFLFSSSDIFNESLFDFFFPIVTRSTLIIEYKWW